MFVPPARPGQLIYIDRRLAEAILVKQKFQNQGQTHNQVKAQHNPNGNKDRKPALLKDAEAFP
jgi:hypothetical protein